MGRGPFTGNSEIVARGLRKRGISLNWRFVKGTWRDGSFAGTLDREIRLWRLTSISIRTHWETWKGTRLPGTFGMDEGGSRDGVSLSEGAHCGGLL
jgi:hypothetical protein